MPDQVTALRAIAREAGVPVTLMSVALATGYVALRYL